MNKKDKKFYIVLMTKYIKTRQKQIESLIRNNVFLYGIPKYQKDIK